MSVMARRGLRIHIAAQLPTHSLKLADALLLGGERLADAGTGAVSSLACASHRRTAVSPSFMSRQTSNAQALLANHLRDLQLELRVECPSLLLGRVPRPGRLHLSRCPGKV